MKQESKVRAQLNEALGALDGKRRRYPGLTYEEGVSEALSWVLGDSDEPPMPEDE